MAFTDKAALKTALASWMHRSSISTQADDVITLAQAGFNRTLPAVLTTQSLTGTADSNEISVSAYSVTEPISLFLAESGIDEVGLTPKRYGTFEIRSSSSRPVYWAYRDDTDKLYFDCPLSGAYPFRFVFKQSFGLATDGATNWLLTNHPDVYLAGCIVWGSLFTDDDGKAGKWDSVLTNGMKEIKAQISRQNRGTLTVDPALAASRSYFNYSTGE
jgi:hypothetical protein